VVAPSHNLAPARWKRAVGRFLTSRGFTHDEWQRTTLGVHHASLLAAVQQVLVQLRQHETQASLLEREALHESWQPWLVAQFGREALLFRQVDPVGIAFGLRWCEILLARELDVAHTIEQPPAAIQQWARDITSPD